MASASRAMAAWTSWEPMVFAVGTVRVCDGAAKGVKPESVAGVRRPRDIQRNIRLDPVSEFPGLAEPGYTSASESNKKEDRSPRESLRQFVEFDQRFARPTVGA